MVAIEFKNLMIFRRSYFIKNDAKQIFFSEKKPTPEPLFASIASPLGPELHEMVKGPEPSIG
jgi:hypothetical protein